MLYLLPSDYEIPTEWDKVYSYLRLWKLGLPVLKSALLTTKDDITKYDLVREFLSSTYTTLRIQYVTPCSSPVRGGNRILLSPETLNSLWSDEYMLWLMEPTDRTKNQYGINIAFDPFYEKVVVEIVGMGFDVSDISRGDITPHQIIVLPDPRYRYSEIWKGAKISIVDQAIYVKSVRLRKEKLESMGLKDSYALPREFKPIPLYLLEKIDWYAQHVFAIAGYRELAVLSCSVLQDGRIIFWDIQTPRSKYAALL